MRQGNDEFTGFYLYSSKEPGQKFLHFHLDYPTLSLPFEYPGSRFDLVYMLVTTFYQYIYTYYYKIIVI
jgi:hypothetical protein